MRVGKNDSELSGEEEHEHEHRLSIISMMSNDSAESGDRDERLSGVVPQLNVRTTPTSTFRSPLDNSR